MIPKECKRLAEVDFPIAEVSKHSVKEKTIKQGHPSSIHMWWARRPLASCRAMLMALLLPDPSDQLCPEDFKIMARKILPEVCGSVGDSDYDLQRKLFQFIADFADWNNTNRTKYIEVSRLLIQVANNGESPLVADFFAGGGSIPIEALRVGCDTFASDLNPVACLILKVMLEDIPRLGTKLVDELRESGDRILTTTRHELTKYYPIDPDGSKPIALLWARTVRCESPNCGAEIPLIRSFWLCKKRNRKVAINYRKVNSSNGFPELEFSVFEPKKESEVHEPTISRAKATCLCCGSVLSPDRVRFQLANQEGGANVIFDDFGNRIGGAKIIAVVTTRDDINERQYRIPNITDYLPIRNAQIEIENIIFDWEKAGKPGLCPIPDEPTPATTAHRAVGSQMQLYGINKWHNIFNDRQLLGLRILLDNIISYSGEALILLTMLFNKSLDVNNSLVGWMAGSENPGHLFARQALPMVWDYVETTMYSKSRGIYLSSLERTIVTIQKLDNLNIGSVSNSSATNSPLPTNSVDVLFTDPPYYDAIPYSDLSDFFYVWFKRALNERNYNGIFDFTRLLTNKDQEIVQCDTVQNSAGVYKNKSFYENEMGKAFTEGARICRKDGIGCIVFAHKSTEGWEALLTGLIHGGWVVTASWPIATESDIRLNAMGTAALATSIHLVCRPRPEDAQVGDWVEVMYELPLKVRKWIDRLESEGIRGADLVFSCIGPALEIYSRYSKVETAEGREVSIAEYLEKVWEVVGRTALEQILGTTEAKARNGVSGALEEDARLTALFLWTLQSSGSNFDTINSKKDDSEDNDDETSNLKKVKGGYSLVYDVARRFAQPLGIDLNKWNNRIIELEKGTVRLMPVFERENMLFGTNAVSKVDSTFDVDPQLTLFPEFDAKPLPKIKGKKITMSGTETEHKQIMVTTLDRVHAAMLLQANGQTNALRALLKSELGRGQDFIRLANALSALYPAGSEEKRLLDAMLVGIK